MPTLLIRMTNPVSLVRLQRAPRLTLSWAEVATISCPNRRADIDRMNAICCWKFAEMDLISFARRRNWRRYQAGGVRNFSVRLAMPNSHLRITSKHGVNNRAFQIWSGVRWNFFNSTARDISWLWMPG